MTNPSNRKRVITDDDLQVLDAHIAYAKEQGDRAAGAASDIQQFVGEAGIVLADIEQTAALAAAAAGITGKINLSTITGADGYYRAMDTGYVYQRTSGANTRRSDLEAVSGPALEVQRGRTGARHNVLPANAAATNTTNFATAMSAMVAAGENTLHLGTGIYYGAIVQNVASLKVTGQGMPAWIGDNVGVGTELRGEIGKDGIWTIQGAAGNVASATVDSLGFRGDKANGILYGLKSTLGDGPGRPFVIRDSTFRKFTAAIRSQVPAGKSTGMFNLSSLGCVYQGNDYILLADGDGAIGNLTFINNVAEQNANGLN